MQKIFSIYSMAISHINRLSPAMMLVLRFWIAHVFFASGLVKIEDFSTTVALFTDEYKVPLLPPYFAALSGTFFELTCPVLLALGLGTRLATLPLLAMTAVIQFTYLDNIQHYYWAMLLGTIFIFGPGKLSIDHFIAKHFKSTEGK